MSVVAVMIYRVTIVTALYGSNNYPKSYVKLTVTMTAATLNLLVIVILNKVA